MFGEAPNTAPEAGALPKSGPGGGLVRFRGCKKARKYGLERFGSVYPSAEFGVRTAEWGDRIQESEWGKGEVSGFLPKATTKYKTVSSGFARFTECGSCMTCRRK